LQCRHQACEVTCHSELTCSPSARVRSPSVSVSRRSVPPRRFAMGVSPVAWSETLVHYNWMHLPGAWGQREKTCGPVPLQQQLERETLDFAESVTLAAVSLAFAGNASVACSLKPLSSGFGVAASATVFLAWAAWSVSPSRCNCSRQSRSSLTQTLTSSLHPSSRT
jgi:hypothetical protein